MMRLQKLLAIARRDIENAKTQKQRDDAFARYDKYTAQMAQATAPPSQDTYTQKLSAARAVLSASTDSAAQEVARQISKEIRRHKKETSATAQDAYTKRLDIAQQDARALDGEGYAGAKNLARKIRAEKKQYAQRRAPQKYLAVLRYELEYEYDADASYRSGFVGTLDEIANRLAGYDAQTVSLESLRAVQTAGEGAHTGAYEVRSTSGKVIAPLRTSKRAQDEQSAANAYRDFLEKSEGDGAARAFWANRFDDAQKKQAKDFYRRAKRLGFVK